MDKDTTLTTLKNLITPLVISQGLNLWGVEIINSSHPTARIFIDAHSQINSSEIVTVQEDNSPSPPQGITIEQCAKISRLIGLMLEVESPFTAQWTLEISSPGLERPFFSLAQMEQYVSQNIQVTLSTAHILWPNRKAFSGSLIHVNLIDETFTLNLSLKQRMPDEPSSICIPWSQVHKAKLIHNFPEPSKPRSSKRLSGDIA